MRVLSINNSTTNSNSFKGLWNIERPRLTSADEIGMKYERFCFYHPFADESKVAVETTTAKASVELCYPGTHSQQIDKLKNIPVIRENLSFTEANYKEYKSFYEDVLPTNIKNVENELKAKKLDQYLNKGLVYNIKKLFHKIKLI